MKLKFPNSYRAFSAMALDMAKFSEQLMADGYGKGTQRVDVPRQVSQASRSPMGQLASSYPGEGFYLQNGASIRARLQARADLGFTAVEQAARDHEVSGLRLTQGGVLGFVLNLFSGLGRALFPKAAQQPAQGRGQPTYGQPTYRQPTGSGQSPFVGSGGTGRDVGETDTGIGGGTSVGGGDSSFSAEVLALTNQYRRDAGRPALVDSPQLIEECKRQVQAQAAQCSFSNFGQQCHCIADQCNGHAENIGIGYTTAQAAAEGWKNSSGHYANMIGNHRTHGAAEFNGHTCQRFGS